MTARRLSVEAILTAVVAALKADATVMALASGGIYNHVPQGTPCPYVEVSCPSHRRQDTCGRWGAETLIDVKVVSQALGDQEAARLLTACVSAVDAQKPTLVGHSALGITYDASDRFRDVVNAIVTRYHVATFRVWTEQSST